jgi:Bacterial Ig-like domain (group 3)
MRRWTRVLLCLLVTAASSWMFVQAAKAAGPTNSLPPTVSGTAQQGQALTVHPGTWIDLTGTLTTITDQWEVCAAGGTGCTAIAGQTGATYTLTAGDVGHTIAILETATFTDGTGTAASAASGLVTGNSTPPAIAGIAREGQILVLTKGIWTDSPTSVSDQWESCSGAACTPVGTLNATSYQLAATDVGHTIEVLETATNAVGALTAASAATAPVLPLVAPANAALPKISGTAQQGQTLVLTQGSWINSPASITDQWAKCDARGANCTPVAGQTGGTYILGAADVGHTLEVLETAANDGGSGPLAVSGPTAVVTATSVTSLTAFSANAPTANQMVTLVASVGSSSANAHPSGSLTFFDGPTALPGCAGRTVSGGQTITVICQASFPAGTAQLVVAYQPDAGSLVAGSTSPPAAVTIGKDSTSISLAVTKRVALRERATYTATLVLPLSNSGPIEPAGSIEFLDHGQPIQGCLSQPLSKLTATCSVQYQSLGTHNISAMFSGDANFTASNSSPSSVQIVKGSAPVVLGFVSSTLQWTFYYHPAYTQVILMKAFGIANGTHVLVVCRGGGCPFHKWQTASTSGGSINLLPVFHHHHLSAGSQITVRLTHPHWVGKYYSFTIRGGRPPRIGLACLAVGRTAPGVGC